MEKSQSSQASKQTEFLTAFLQIGASRNGSSGEECVVSDEAFISIANPNVVAAALKDFPLLRQKLMNAVFTALNESQTNVSISANFYGACGVPFVSVMLTTALAADIKPSVIRDALSPAEWVNVLPNECAWQIASHETWYAKHPIGLRRALDAVDRFGTLTWDEKRDAVGTNQIATALPRKDIEKYFSLTEATRSSGKPMDPETIRKLVSNEIIVTINPQIVWNIVMAAARKLGIMTAEDETETKKADATKSAAVAAEESQSVPIEPRTSPGFPTPIPPPSQNGTKNGNGPVVVRGAKDYEKPSGPYSLALQTEEILGQPDHTSPRLEQFAVTFPPTNSVTSDSADEMPTDDPFAFKDDDAIGSKPSGLAAVPPSSSEKTSAEPTAQAQPSRVQPPGLIPPSRARRPPLP